MSPAEAGSEKDKERRRWPEGQLYPIRPALPDPASSTRSSQLHLIQPTPPDPANSTRSSRLYLI